MVRALSAHECEIRDALAELKGARLVAERCPSTENLRTVQICEDYLNALLDESLAAFA